MTFRKATNIALVALAAAFLCGTIGLKAASELGAQLPDWMAVGQTRSSLEGRNYQGRPTPTAESVSAGQFQSSLEKYISDLTPMRDNVMLANATMQRAAIATANMPFNWECYPTYFGSSRLRIPSQKALTYLPEKRSEDRLSTLRAFGQNLADAAQRHPGMRFVVCVVQAYQDPSVNPAYGLMSDPMAPTEQIEALRQGAQAAGNVSIVTESYGTLDEYYAEFFRTDHHWNYRGSERAYGGIAAALGLSPFSGAGEFEVPDYDFTGATARWGLDALSEKVVASTYEFPGLQTVDADGQVTPYGHEQFASRQDAAKRYSFYDSYYTLSGNTLLGGGSGKALILSNSFGSCLAPYIAENYGETAVDSSLLNPSKSDPSARFEQQANLPEADDVIIVANPHDIAAFAASCPDYFASA